jgi:hypothetical protein
MDHLCRIKSNLHSSIKLWLRALLFSLLCCTPSSLLLFS